MFYEKNFICKLEGVVKCTECVFLQMTCLNYGDINPKSHFITKNYCKKH